MGEKPREMFVDPGAPCPVCKQLSIGKKKPTSTGTCCQNPKCRVVISSEEKVEGRFNETWNRVMKFIWRG